jgi:hypothetical protein
MPRGRGRLCACYAVGRIRVSRHDSDHRLDRGFDRRRQSFSPLDLGQRPVVGAGILDGGPISGIPRSVPARVTCTPRTGRFCKRREPLENRGFLHICRRTFVSTPDRIRTYNLRFRRRAGKLSRSNRTLELVPSYTNSRLLQDGSSLRVVSRGNAVLRGPSR